MDGNYVKILKTSIITNDPIVYYWWFKEECTLLLLKALKGNYDEFNIKKKFIDGIEYSLLYIGRAKKGHDRLIKYHILDSSDFHTKGVENGRLSSLRQTLCGLLGFKMSLGKSQINTFIADHCYVEWDIVTLEKLNENEKQIITSNYLPLNYQNTKGILTPEHRSILSSLKKKVRN